MNGVIYKFLLLKKNYLVKIFNKLRDKLVYINYKFEILI